LFADGEKTASAALRCKTLFYSDLGHSVAENVGVGL
jgi:hypothetical protein